MEKRGRKSKYETHVFPYLTEIQEWARELEEQQICKRLGIGKSAWNEYKKKYPELASALKEGHQDLVTQLRSALIKKAKGYRYTETKVTEERVKWPEELYEKLLKAGLKDEEISMARIVKTETAKKEYTPDVAAINLALKNYDKENWANDPQMLEIRREELELQKKKIEENDW